MDALKDEEKGLPAQIKTADTALRNAQKLLIEAKNKLVLNIDADSEAFAEARDNEPVFVAPIDGTSKDPLKQIAIWAFGNRKILYLRGTPANVTKAKNIISFFDRPAPQARLSLWTLELSGQTSARKNLDEFNESLKMVDSRLSNTRAQISATLAFLRKCINEQVDVVAAQRLKGIKPGKNLNSEYVDLQRWARSFFYEEEVLKRLGFDETPPQTRDDEARIVALNTLPDPVSAGTLGEALVILSLAKAQYRRDIMNRFICGIEKEIADVSNNDNNYTDTVKIDSNSFNLTKKALEADHPTSSYTPIQNEIVNSIILASVPRLFRRLDQLKLGQAPVFDSTASKSPGAAKDNMKKEVKSVIDFVWYAYGLSAADLFGFDISPDDAATELVSDMDVTTTKFVNAKTQAERALIEPPKIARVAQRLSCINDQKNIFRLANAQIAKADNLIKQLIDAFDEDVNRAIVQPTVYGLRKNITDGKQISVGIINRTSLLATNRLSARVDARGSAQLTVGEEQDILAEAQQLANILLSAKTGNILGAFNSLQSTKQEKDTSEVYGINSGDIFKVTPVFDPAGQSLRFQFDHTHGNFITDPDGSVQPALPRIERHTVNTEVQLANLELREISRFETNEKIGIPTTYKGGVPIFRDIPYVNKVPLLGWFVRRSGKAATVQESLILGQTTMYPTIADIFDLLSGDDYNYISRDTQCHQ